VEQAGRQRCRAIRLSLLRREWVRPLRELSEQAEQAYAFFNNNGTSPDGRGGRMAQAAANAKELQRLLQAEKVPVSAPT